MTNLQIRKASDSDYSEIKKLVKQLYDNLEVKDGKEKVLSFKKFSNLINDHSIMILVAKINSNTLGYLTLNFNKTLLDIGISAIIDELVIDTDFRGKGLGKRLVAEAVKNAKELGCSEIGVGTEIENTDARDFYKSCGFDEIGVIFEKHLVKKMLR